ncbi:MAG: XRE family transcriptional regulator [Chloroflexia bacterium]|nr:XRE family transcriptional regulator [Chloroflexia bacterium]
MSHQEAHAYDRAVGGLIRALRRQYRVKQAQLAARLGVDVATISRYERGERSMTVGMLLLIADQFGVPAGTLLPAQHQPADKPMPAHPAPAYVDALDQLPELEAGAVTSIVQGLAARPELIVPVLAVFAQAAEVAA